MAEVQLKKIKKSFGRQEVIHGVDLEIRDGEFVALVGPSGCGKSTLLRMIAGLESVSDGEIRIAERNVNSVHPKDRDIAMVFQNYALYPNLTVRENMAFSLTMRGDDSKAKIDDRVAKTAQILGLEDFLDRHPRALSGGQRQRVAMGRAIIRQPKVFLFDEPLSNLDAKLRVKMRTEIKQLHQQLRTTTVYVTHDQIEAMTMADKVVVLKDGSIAQIGSPLELYHRPANMFVAGFIGSPAMNFLSANIQNGQLTICDSAISSFQNTKFEGAVTLGIRPEHIVQDAEGFEAEVVVVEPTGPETFVMLRAFDTDLLAILREDDIPSPGDVLRLGFQVGRMHFFDTESGERLDTEPNSD